MSTLKILLVCIHVAPCDEAVPLGAACVASALKAAFPGAPGDDGPAVSVSILEAYASEKASDLAGRILAAGADLVGFSLYSWNRSRALAAASLVRGRDRRALLFCGGPEATSLADGLSTASGGPFDFVVAGEGESAAAELARLLAAGEHGAAGAPGEPIAGRVEAVETLPSPWLDGTLKPKSDRGVLWELARGCPYGCAYCYESKGSRTVRYFPEERIAAELRLFSAAGVPAVFVLDPTFNANRERATRLLDLLAAEAPDIHWHFEVRAEALDRGQARRFAALGASLQIGLQTADPEVSARVGRKLDRGLFASKIGLLNEAGAVFGLDLMYGLPGDTFAGYRRSLDFAISLYPNNLDLFRLSVLPGTALAEEASALGLVNDPSAPYLVRSTPTFSAAELDGAERLSAAADLFYNRGRAVAWFNQVLHPLGAAPSLFLEGFADFLDGRLSAGASRSAPAGRKDGKAGRADGRGSRTQAAPAPAAGGSSDWATLMDRSDPVALERLQLAYLDRLYEEAELDYLLPALWDIVRFHGAWGRALAEGIATDIDCSYDPDEVIGRGPLDLEQLASMAEPSPCRVRVRPGAVEPEVTVTA